jgi:hypothetical protein
MNKKVLLIIILLFSLKPNKLFRDQSFDTMKHERRCGGWKRGELRRNNKNIRHLLQAEGETGEIDDLLDRVDERNRSKMIQPEPKEVNKIARKKNNK